LKLNGPGIYPIEGFGWSGNGIIKAVDVTFDGGKAWREATLEEPILDRCLTRSAPFGSGGGGPAKIATPRHGQHRLRPAEPRRDREDARAYWVVQHHNGIFRWSISPGGEVKNSVA
jgi:sulfane dehydrogenase subunit SoxC